MSAWYHVQTVSEGRPEGWAANVVRFDPYVELLWTGNQNGFTASYAGTELQRYVSFAAHQTEVRGVLPMNTRLVTMGTQEVKCWKRSGVQQMKLTSEKITNLQCLAPTPRNDNAVILGGLQDALVVVDVERGRVLKEQSTRQANGTPGGGVVALAVGESSAHIACGMANGKVELRDPNSLRSESVIDAFDGALSSMAVHSNTIAMCGYNSQDTTAYVQQHVVKIYDVRMVKPVCVVPFVHIPQHLKFLPNAPSQLMVASQSGQFQVLDVSNVSQRDVYGYHIDTRGGFVTALDVSSSGALMVVSDSLGCIHQFSTDSAHGGVRINNESRKIDYPDDMSAEIQDIELFSPKSSRAHPDRVIGDKSVRNLQDRTARMARDSPLPLSIIKMPYVKSKEKLLSDWPASLTRFYRKPPQPVDAQILSTLKMSDFVGFAKNSGKRLRNQVEWKPQSHNQNRGLPGYSRTHPHRGGHVNTGPHTHGNHGNQTYTNRRNLFNSNGSDSSEGESDPDYIPRPFRRKEIKYSRLGLEDFDFSRHNRTRFGGLEPYASNAYSNALLQAWYFIGPVRDTLQQHICRKEHCLACEMSFLFHMLDLSKGQNCQASNFVRAFQSIPQASALGLLINEDSGSQADKGKVIQGFNRFLLTQLHSDMNLADERPSATPTPTPTPTQTPQLHATPKAHAHPTPHTAPHIDRTTHASGEGSVRAQVHAPTSVMGQGRARTGQDGRTAGAEAQAQPHAGAGGPTQQKMGAGHHAPVYTPTVNIGDNFRTRVMTRSTCQYCSTPRERATDSLVFDLTYRTASDESPVSSKNSSADAKNPLRRSSSAHLNRKPAFVDVLCNSMVRETMTKAYCETCQGYKQTLLQRRLTALPDVLAVSCGAMNQADLAIWRHTAQPHTGDPPSGSTNDHTGTAAAVGKERSGPVRTRSVSDGDIHDNVFSQGPPEQSQRKDSWLPSGLIASIRDKGLSITADTREEIQRRKLATTTPKHTPATSTHTHTNTHTHTTTPTASATAHTRPVQPHTQPPQQQQQPQALAPAHAHAQRYAHVEADGDASGKDVRNAEYVLTSVVCTIAGKHGGNVVALVWVDGEYHNRANSPPYVGTRLLCMQSQQAEYEPRNTSTTPEPHITPIASSGQISERNPAPKSPHKASEARESVSTATAPKATSTDANGTTTPTATTTPHTNSTLPKNTNPHTNSTPHTTSTLPKNTTPHTNSTLTGTQGNGAQKTASAMRGGWYVFNDFAINPVTEDDAIDFSMVWKVPCLLYYTRAEFVAADDPIDTKSAHTTANRPMSSTDKHAAAQPKASATDALKDCATSATRRPQRDVQSKAEPNLRTTNANAHTQSNPNISLSLHMSTHTPHTTHETSKGTAATDAPTATPTPTPTVTAIPTLGSNTAGSVSDKTLTNTETPSSASAKTETALTRTTNTQTAPSTTAQEEKSVTAYAQTESGEGTNAEISGAADGTTPKTQQPQALQSDSVGQVVSAEDAATDRPVPTLADQSAGVRSAAPTATTSTQANAHAHTQQQPQQQQQQPQQQQSQQQLQQQAQQQLQPQQQQSQQQLQQQSQQQLQQQSQQSQPQPPPQPSYTRFQLIQSKTIPPQTFTAPPPPQVPPNLNIDPTLPTHVQQHPLHKYIPQSAVHKLGAPTAAIRPRTPIEGPTLAERLQRHPQTQAQPQAHPTTASKPQLYLRQITPSGRTSPSNGSGSRVSNDQSTPVNGSVVSADRKSFGRQAAVAGSAGDKSDVNTLRAPNKSSKITVDISLDVFVNDSEYSTPTKFAKAATPHIIVPITSEDSLPARGAKVAIDAEFVALEMEEAAIRSNGAKSTIRPSQLCLARVSVLWAEGTAIGTAFIDDYIYTTEPVTDYLTQFSGINPGDLNPAVSKKHLVSLKTTYLKLRVLADRGCVFVGHGLKKDFRIINMIVPPHQVIDTVELFYMPRQRRVSLRFLAWFLLRMDIQESVHDSVEDARTALFLYEKYKQLEASGMLEETIRSVYDAGRHYKWRAPHWP